MTEVKESWPIVHIHKINEVFATRVCETIMDKKKKTSACLRFVLKAMDCFAFWRLKSAKVMDGVIQIYDKYYYIIIVFFFYFSEVKMGVISLLSPDYIVPPLWKWYPLSLFVIHIVWVLFL